MRPDPLIDDVRRARREISRECEHDIWKLYARYEAMQRRMKSEGTRRFVSEPPVPSTPQTPETDPTAGK